MTWLKRWMNALARGSADLSPSCRHAVRLQSESLDHPLSARQRIGLRIHLLLCQWCRRYQKQVGFLRKAAHEHPELMIGPAPHKLSDEARQRIKDKLRSDNG